MNSLRAEIEKYFDRLWPICRSLAGPGFRESLDILSELMPTERFKFKSGEAAFDWTVPNEWVIRDAYLIDPKGKKRADFKVNNLHIVSHSTPFSGTIALKELKLHLHSLPEEPNAIPYVTSYYKRDWGFCLTHREFRSLPNGNYRVFIDSELKPGHLELGEAVLKGETDEEIFFSTYLCHPSLANNELSGPLLTAFLYKKIASLSKRRYTYRFVVVPEAIGSICYLNLRGAHLKKKLKAGYVITCVGDSGPFTYKTSRDGNTLADRAAKLILQDLGKHTIVPFFPNGGSDERQYCSPGFNLPVGSLMRTMYGKYPEYHTSLDNKKFISFDALLGSLCAYETIVQALEANETWCGTVLYGEPQLGKRGLYPKVGKRGGMKEKLSAMMWLLNLADGTKDLFAIAEHSRMSVSLLISVADELSKAGLVKKSDGF